MNGIGGPPPPEGEGDCFGGSVGLLGTVRNAWGKLRESLGTLCFCVLFFVCFVFVPFSGKPKESLNRDEPKKILGILGEPQEP